MLTGLAVAVTSLCVYTPTSTAPLTGAHVLCGDEFSIEQEKKRKEKKASSPEAALQPGLWVALLNGGGG